MARKKKQQSRLHDAKTISALCLAESLGRFAWTKTRRGPGRKVRTCDRTKTHWSASGPYAVNPLRQVPQGVADSLNRLMEKFDHDYHRVLKDVDPRKLFTFQHSLTYRKLTKYIRRFREVSRQPTNCHYPCAVQLLGRLILWNGNHRTVAALCRGEKLPRVNIINLDAQIAKARRARERAAA